jgi:hypothetical protein
LKNHPETPIKNAMDEVVVMDYLRHWLITDPVSRDSNSLDTFIIGKEGETVKFTHTRRSTRKSWTLRSTATS